jgi:hypothetical protein
MLTRLMTDTAFRGTNVAWPRPIVIFHYKAQNKDLLLSVILGFFFILTVFPETFEDGFPQKMGIITHTCTT